MGESSTRSAGISLLRVALVRVTLLRVSRHFCVCLALLARTCQSLLAAGARCMLRALIWRSNAPNRELHAKPPVLHTAATSWSRHKVFASDEPEEATKSVAIYSLANI